MLLRKLRATLRTIFPVLVGSLWGLVPLAAADPAPSTENAPADAGSSQQDAPADAASSQQDAPARAIAAAEDWDFDRARAWVEKALLDHPADPAPKVLRQWIACESDPFECILAHRAWTVDPGDPPLVRLEACWAGWLALVTERDRYRGDRDEDATTFIARLEARAHAIQVAVEGIQRSPELGPWRSFLARALRRFLHQPPEQVPEDFWASLEAPEPWATWLRILAVDHGLVPDHFAFTQILQIEERLTRATAPLELRLTTTALLLKATRLTVPDTLQHFREVAQYYPDDDGYLDDFQLAWGRTLAHGYRDEWREQALEVLRPLLEGPWRNTTSGAMQAAAFALRRLERYQDALALVERFRERFPAEADRADRETGRANYGLGRYEPAAEAFRRAAEGRWGRGKDYLYLAEAMRFLPETVPERYDRDRVRAEALKLIDFASDARCREKRVKGWADEIAPQVVELQCRFVELVGLSRHALLFPATFLSMGSLGLVDLLAVALGLVAFVSFPRLSRRSWVLAAWLTLAGTALTIPALGSAVASGSSAAAMASWWVQAGARLFFMLAGAVVLSPAAGLPGLATVRGLRRSLRRGDPGRWLVRAWPLLVGAALLTLITLGAAWIGRTPTSYLARLPHLVTVGELGAPPGGSHTFPDMLLALFALVRLEVLTRGIVLTILAYLFRPIRLGHVSAVLATAALSALLLSGTMEPTPVHAAATFASALVLGATRVRFGLDGALLVHVCAFLICGGMP